MAVKPVPEGYQSVIPYLSVANARAVIDEELARRVAEQSH